MNFLAAVESKFLNVPHEIMLASRGENKSDFCYSVKECRASYPEAMDAAIEFYRVKHCNYCFFRLSRIYEDGEEHPLQLQLKNILSLIFV